ncbi:MAG TPA: phosphatase PAP2 family protein [Acidimicrobiales bacterium]|nr:phosphatase PAP2 family protein [Acidimicrobiales bacterium]
MTDALDDREATAPADAARPRLRWWREVSYAAGFYLVYSLIRNATAAESVRVAFDHARSVIRVERLLGLYHEETIQALFLHYRWLVKALNVYYGSLHFVVTIAALVWCFRRRPDRYPLWRNTLAATTALALIGFALFPLMPPRLLDACNSFGACSHYGFVDTLERIGGLWSFDSGTMKSISNQYAAMPSLHFAWSLWCAGTLWPLTRERDWAKPLIAAYPALTLFAIVVTANHFFLDAVGGALVFAAGYVVASAIVARRSNRGVDGADVASAP